jgi:phenylacetate-coenzyme A ligase PaaK-like adenylate-forming protein
LDTFKSFQSQLYTVNDQSFTNIAFALFRFQATHNKLYNTYIKNLGLDILQVKTLKDIPFLPISFFKKHSIKTGEWEETATFCSSGTTGQITSSHAVYDLSFYRTQSAKCFRYFFGELSEYHFFALLPSYLERSNSSLVAMMDYFIKESQSPFSGFYLHNTDTLLSDLDKVRKENRKTILWGVTYALLDIAERYKPDLSHCYIVETGGMKGKRQEIIRLELHEILRKELNVGQIYSEYGMTELLSQAYTKGADRFWCPPWMKILSRDLTDPMHKGLLEETGGINIIDLANWHSIAFIETEDLGKVFDDGSFEILGRMDNSDVRGCNLMVQ